MGQALTFPCEGEGTLRQAQGRPFGRLIPDAYLCQPVAGDGIAGGAAGHASVAGVFAEMCCNLMHFAAFHSWEQCRFGPFGSHREAGSGKGSHRMTRKCHRPTAGAILGVGGRRGGCRVEVSVRHGRKSRADVLGNQEGWRNRACGVGKAFLNQHLLSCGGGPLQAAVRIDPVQT